MIEEIALTNYRGFDDHTVSLRERTLIVGKNNAGKSTVVEALRLVTLVTERIFSLTFRNAPPWTGLPPRVRGVAPSLASIVLNRESLFYRYGDPPGMASARFASGARVDVHIGPDAALHAVVYDDRGRLVTSREEARKLALPAVSILPQISPLPEEETILTPDYVRASVSTTRSSLHFRNQLHYMHDHFQAFQDLAEHTWPGLRVRGLEGRDGMPGKGRLSLIVQDGDFSGEVSWMGHGLQMWLQTMWFLCRTAEARTVILDEPDVYMHADLQRRLIRFLKSSTARQVIVATHSPEIMAEVGADDVVVIDRNRRTSKYAGSIPAVQRVLENIGSVHNIGFARLAMARALLMVEGEDIAFLKRLQDAVLPDSAYPIDTIPSTDIGGWGGWGTARGLTRALSNAADQEVVGLCLFDRDYHTDDELKDRHEQAEAARIELKIWSRKEIENYLLVPEAITRVVQSRCSIAGPSPAEVSWRIEMIADELHDEIQDAFANNFLLLDKPGGLTPANRRAREHMQAVWSSGTKPCVAPGKRIISELSKWTQDRYKVSLSPLAIASELRAEEVDSEVTDFLQRVEALMAKG